MDGLFLPILNRIFQFGSGEADSQGPVPSPRPIRLLLLLWSLRAISDVTLQVLPGGTVSVRPDFT